MKMCFFLFQGKMKINYSLEFGNLDQKLNGTCVLCVVVGFDSIHMLQKLKRIFKWIPLLLSFLALNKNRNKLIIEYYLRVLLVNIILGISDRLIITFLNIPNRKKVVGFASIAQGKQLPINNFAFLIWKLITFFENCHIEFNGMFVNTLVIFTKNAKSDTRCNHLFIIQCF